MIPVFPRRSPLTLFSIQPTLCPQIDPEDRERFAELTEAELVSLHEGNFARYRVRPSEFAAWQNIWEA
jgi:hypothetical protein